MCEMNDEIKHVVCLWIVGVCGPSTLTALVSGLCSGLQWLRQRD